ncbi:MAG: septation protein SepH [Candidatus Planktophila sp.]
MSELRLHGKNNEGTHLTLVDNDGTEFSLRISDTLRATVNQPRLSAVPSEDADQTISVKEIQRRLRAGDAPEVIAREGNTTVDKVARFSGPILQEREYILSQARSASLRKDSTRLDISFLEAVINKLVPRGVDADELSWNTWRLPDATWHIELHFPNRDGNGIATWNFDTSRRTINPTDDNGAWLIGEEAPARVIEPGFITAEPTHPSRVEPVAPVELPGASSLFSPVVVEEEKPETPRLVAIRDTPSAADSEDGVVARAKIPSWDEIMFGSKAPVADAPETQEDYDNN